MDSSSYMLTSSPFDFVPSELHLLTAVVVRFIGIAFVFQLESKVCSSFHQCCADNRIQYHLILLLSYALNHSYSSVIILEIIISNFFRACLSILNVFDNNTNKIILSFEWPWRIWRIYTHQRYKLIWINQNMNMSTFHLYHISTTCMQNPNIFDYCNGWYYTCILFSKIQLPPNKMNDEYIF